MKSIVLKKKVVYLFYRSQKGVQWNSTEIDGPDFLVRAVIALFEGVDSEWPEEVEVIVGVYHGLVASPFLFTVFHIVTELAMKGLLNKVL